MQRPVVVTAIKARQLSASLTAILEANCWVRPLMPHEYGSINGILRRAEPTVLVMDLEIAEQSLELERLGSPPPFGLVLVAPRDAEAAIEWLNRGADAVLQLPVSAEEVAAQTLSLARKRLREDAVPHSEYVNGDLRIDLNERMVFHKGTASKLSATEYRLLSTLVKNAGRTMPHNILLATVWGEEYEDDLSLLRAYILRLRKKLGDSGHTQTYIRTQGQLGYTMPKSDTTRNSTPRLDRVYFESVLHESAKLKEISQRSRDNSRRIRAELAQRRRTRNDVPPAFEGLSDHVTKREASPR